MKKKWALKLLFSIDYQDLFIKLGSVYIYWIASMVAWPVALACSHATALAHQRCKPMFPNLVWALEIRKNQNVAHNERRRNKPIESTSA